MWFEALAHHITARCAPAVTIEHLRRVAAVIASGTVAPAAVVEALNTDVRPAPPRGSSMPSSLPPGSELISTSHSDKPTAAANDALTDSRTLSGPRPIAGWCT